MNEENFSNEYQSEQMNRNEKAELQTGGGRFSSQSQQNSYTGNSYNAGENYTSDSRSYGYSNGTYRDMNHSNAYGQSAGNYQYSNVYSKTNQYEQKPKEKQENSSYFKTALICVSLGLFFGIFA